MVPTERSCHKEYQISNTHCSNVIRKIKVFKNGSSSYAKVTGSKNNGTHEEVLLQGILMWNFKALALIVQKLLARLKFSQNGSNFKVTVTGSRIMVPAE